MYIGIRYFGENTVHQVVVVCAAMLVSTCYVQLYLAGALLGSLCTLLLHPRWWQLVYDNIWWPLSIVFIICWHITSQQILNRVITDGKRIKWPFVWLFAYVGLSAGYCVVRSWCACASDSDLC